MGPFDPEDWVDPDAETDLEADVTCELEVAPDFKTVSMRSS